MLLLYPPSCLSDITLYYFVSPQFASMLCCHCTVICPLCCAPCVVCMLCVCCVYVVCVRQLIDFKRSNNVSIGLAQFKDFAKFEDIAQAVAEMDTRRLPQAKVMHGMAQT